MNVRDLIALAMVPALLVFVVVAWRRLRQRRIGPAASGAFYDLLGEDRRNAVEIIVEQKAEATDPEDAEDNHKPRRSERITDAGSSRP